jgi:hypothetical protein
MYILYLELEIIIIIYKEYIKTKFFMIIIKKILFITIVLNLH